jgi:biotin synthase
VLLNQQTMAHRNLVRALRVPVLPRAQHSFRGFSTVLDGHVDPQTQRITPPIARHASSVYENALHATGPRTNWTKDEITEVYNTSLIDLTYASVCNVIAR